MRVENKNTSCNKEMLFEFATGSVSRKDAEAIKAHLKSCEECREIYAGLCEFNDGLEDLKSIELEPDAKEQIWGNLQESIEKSNKKVQVKNAWKTILHTRVAFAAAAVLLILVIGVVSYNYLTPFGYSDAVSGAKITLADGQGKQIYFPVGAKADFSKQTRASILTANKNSGIVFLAKGSVNSKINKLQGKQSYEVHTEDAVFSVKGTAFNVIKDNPDSSRITVDEGIVWVEPKGKNRKLLVLTAGESATVLGEKAHLRKLKHSGEEAFNNTKFHQAEAIFRLYLDSSSKKDNSQVEFLLAETCQQMNKVKCAIDLYNKISLSENNLRVENAFASLVQLQLLKNKKAVKHSWERYLMRFPEGNFKLEALLFLAQEECKSGAGEYYRQFMKFATESKLKEVVKSQCESRD